MRTIDQSGSAYTDYLHYDHLGSVDTITDDSGNVIQSMSFDAFGLRRDPSNWNYDLSQNTIATLKNYTDRGYTDQEELDNLSLVDLNGRVYDPTVGRMISADPTVPDSIFSQAFNRFTYVYNSPLEYVDPSGYCASSSSNAKTNINLPEYLLGTFHIAAGGVTEVGSALLMMGAVAGAFESAGASLLALGVGVAGTIAGGAILQRGMHETNDALQNTDNEGQMPPLLEGMAMASDAFLNPASAIENAAVNAMLTINANSSCNNQPDQYNHKQQTKPPAKNPPAPPKAPPSEGGGEGNHNWSATHAIICTTTYYDWYVGSPGNLGTYQFTVSVTECD